MASGLNRGGVRCHRPVAERTDMVQSHAAPNLWHCRGRCHAGRILGTPPTEPTNKAPTTGRKTVEQDAWYGRAQRSNLNHSQSALSHQNPSVRLGAS